ncbi:HAD-IIIA family hydrolase [Spiroplasma endosymbiont of Aspidapion aeneum]|uniref:YqeG family HAD IIIA-type phosphatase n=1 Tax=Spiroplasma endosymbiont of Aspidapion aeneum TaxID=3066276 RepID=UPI00313B0980
MERDQNFLLFNYFRPTMYLESYKKVNLEALKNSGIKLILCDMDNTLIRFDERIPSIDVINFVRKVNEMGFEFVIFSNNIKSRVTKCAQKAGVKNYFWNCKKPFLGKLKVVKKLFRYKNNEIILIGDQLITDVFVANRANIKSILVEPLSKTIIGDNKIVRFIEKFIFKTMNRKNLLHEGFYNESEYEDGYEIL